MAPLSKISAFVLSVSLALTFVTLVGGAPKTQARVLYIGAMLSLTGGDVEDATLELNAARLAIEEANAKGGVAGYKLELIVLNDATATAGQFDPLQAATNAKKLAANPGVVAILGPQSSAEGKAAAPILSEADLPCITMSATNPDITNPKFASQYRPKGRVVYFRTVTTDAYQGPAMANFLAEKLNVKSVFVVDDEEAYGVGTADSFQARATAKGIKVLGRDQVNPKEADYTTILTKIKGLNPQALYLGAAGQAGAKFNKQAYDVMPKTIKAGGDGILSADFLKGGGFPASQGWYMTQAAPHPTGDPKAQGFVNKFHQKWGKYPSDYAVTAYDAILVILDSIGRVAKSGKPVNRHTVRDAIQTTHLNTLQGVISFDANGDIVPRVVTIFQIVHDPKYADDDLFHQAKYIGIAPEH
jgi:branched-chain amino acid transport system substrate-binding protein